MLIDNIENNNRNNNQKYLQSTNLQPMHSINSANSEKNGETFAIIAFVLSLFGIFSTFFSTIFGLIPAIIVYYLSSKGLKTRKKVLSIVAIILASISLIINIICTNIPLINQLLSYI